MLLNRPMPNLLYHGGLHIYDENCSFGSDALCKFAREPPLSCSDIRNGAPQVCFSKVVQEEKGSRLSVALSPELQGWITRERKKGLKNELQEQLQRLAGAVAQSGTQPPCCRPLPSVSRNWRRLRSHSAKNVQTEAYKPRSYDSLPSRGSRPFQSSSASTSGELAPNWPFTLIP